MKRSDENDFERFQPDFKRVKYEQTRSEKIQFWIAFIALIVFGIISIVFVY
jgi:nitrate reductase NapE component